MFKPNFGNITIAKDTQDELFRMFCSAIQKVRYKEPKKPKGKAGDGEYCPKEKPGQSWAHAGKKEEEG